MTSKLFNVELIPAIRRLQLLAAESVTTKTTGEHKSVFKGKGLEFSDYREYTSNDDASLIDWKASSRAQKTLIREYVEERDVNILFALDVSSSMLFGSTEKLKNEYAIELVASLAHATSEAGDSVGLCLYNDKIVSKALPEQGPQQFYKLSKLLLDTESYGGNSSLEPLEKFVMNSLKSTTVIMIISDFMGLPPNWPDSIKKLASKFDIIGVRVVDPRDKTLPEGNEQVVINDPYSNQELIIEPKLLKKAYEEEAKKQERIITEAFTHNKAKILTVETDKSFVKPIINFFRGQAVGV